MIGVPYARLIREISKFSFLGLNCHFRMKKLKNSDKSELPDFYEFTLYMNFANFVKVAIPMMADVKNFKNHFIGCIRQNPESHPSYPFCDFPSKRVLKFFKIN